MRFAIADSIATVEMSVPLDHAGWSEAEASLVQWQRELQLHLRGDEGFRFDANWLEANGHRLSGGFLRYGTRRPSTAASAAGLRKASRKQGSSEVWRNVKTMTLDEDKLVIITRGG